MKFILFFSLISITAIAGFVVAEKQIVSSGFYQTYLDAPSSHNRLDAKPIKTSELPADILRSLESSKFGKHTISQIYFVPAKNTSHWVSQFFNDYSELVVFEETYLLSLTDHESSTQLKFSKHGKLIEIINT